MVASVVRCRREDLAVSRDKGREERPPSHPERIGPLLEAALERLGIAREVASQSALSRWDRIVGEAIAEVTRPKAVSNGVLFVEVASSGWLTELNLMRRDILARLNAGQSEGRVEKVVFTMSEDLSQKDRGDRSR